MYQYATKVMVDDTVGYEVAFVENSKIIFQVTADNEIHFFRLLDYGKPMHKTNMVELNAGQLIFGFPVASEFNKMVEHEINFELLTPYEAPIERVAKPKTTSPKKKMTVSAPTSMKKGGGGASGGGGGPVLDV